MKLSLSPSLVKQSLAGHSWLGLLVGALMYLVCLTGTLAVFFEEFERWEQPAVHESADFDPAVAEGAFNRLLADDAQVTEHMYLVFPSGTVPRLSVHSEDNGWFVNPDGSLGPKAQHEWTHLLTDLHLYLTLPESWGMIVVSILGALLCGLIISGFLAHPGIFKEAFSLRLKGSRRLEQVDIHNRLSVWGAPFHLVIALTGAYFGLVLLILAAAADSSGRDSEAMLEDIFGAEPALQQESRQVNVTRALDQLDEIAPQAEPMYVLLHDAGTPGQFMEIFSRHRDRLIWSENYRFDNEGNYLGKAGYSDGAAGKQISYSVYRIHFGHFGGFGVKVLYVLLGLALTVVSVTGINIWLEKRKRRDFLNHLWPALVWGTPAVLALTLITQLLLAIPSTGIFWGALLAAGLYGVWRRDAPAVRWQLQGACSLLLLAFLAAYGIKHGPAAVGPAALGVNLGLLLTALVLGWLAWRQYRGRDIEAPVGDLNKQPAT